LDYLGASDFDNSDGTSLRRFIEGTSYNKMYDEGVVICELDGRIPKENNDGTIGFKTGIGTEPNFMVRKDDIKLMIPKARNSDVVDMMYNISADPYELNNLLGYNGMDASDEVIGKAEHLKVCAVFVEYKIAQCSKDLILPYFFHRHCFGNL